MTTPPSEPRLLNCHRMCRRLHRYLRRNSSNRWWTSQWTRRGNFQAVRVAQKTAEIPQIQFIDRAVDTSVEQQWQVPTVQTIREAVEASQAQFRDKVDGIPVVVQRKVPMIQSVQKTVEVPKIQYVDKVVEAPVAAAQQSVPVDAEFEDVSVGTQTVSRKRKISMETESAESADGTSDTEHGLVQGGESRREMDETRENHAAGEDLDLLPVAPNMEAGGSHLQAMTEEERIEIWTQDLREDPPNGRVLGASGKETRRQGGRGDPEA